MTHASIAVVIGRANLQRWMRQLPTYDRHGDLVGSV